MPIGKLQQAIDGFQVLNAATKWIHDLTKTRRKNKLKVANGNALSTVTMFRSCHAGTLARWHVGTLACMPCGTHAWLRLARRARGTANWQSGVDGNVRQILTPRSMSEN